MQMATMEEVESLFKAILDYQTVKFLKKVKG